MNNIEYALETMDAGVLILSKNGTVNYSNPQARAIFEIPENNSIKLFKEIIENTEQKNNELVDLVIDIIHTKNLRKSQIIPYTNHSGQTFYLLMSCSKMSNNEFVFTFSNQSELVHEGQKRIDSTAILTSFFVLSCLWTIGVSIWIHTGKVFEVGYLTIIMEVIATINMIILLHKTSIHLKDLGFSTEMLIPTLKRTVVRVIVLFTMFCALKLIILQFNPGFFKENTPFWDWKQADFRLIKYMFTAFIQEFLSRGGVQESLSRVFEGKHRKNYAIYLTSIFFMALHFQYGLPMMFGAGALSILLGYFYKKDQNIYGVTIIHYCFGKFADFLHFL